MNAERLALIRALAERILQLPADAQALAVEVLERIVAGSGDHVQREVLRRVIGGVPLEAALETLTGDREVPLGWMAD